MFNAAIIGFGAAGYNAAKTIRELRPDARIDVYEKDEGVCCPILTTYFAEAKIDYDHMFPYGDMETICRQLDLNWIRKPVEKLDPTERSVRTVGGTQSYDAVLVASGASAICPRFIQLEEGRQVFFMRTARDAVALKEYLDSHPVRKAAVVGASMVGIKVAEVLYLRGIETTLFDGAEHIFPLNAYPDIAGEITDWLEEKGVTCRMATAIKAVVRDGLVLSDDSVFEAELVCLCVGIRANLSFLEDGALKTGKGLIVNTRMETSVPGVYAAGDCSEGRDVLSGEPAQIGLWANAGAQGVCAGKNMAGVPTEYYGNVPNNIARFMGALFAGAGDPKYPGERAVFRGEHSVAELTKDRGRIVSFNVFGDCSVNGTLRNLLIKQAAVGGGRLSPMQCARIRKAGFSDDFISFIRGEQNDE